MLFSYKSAVIEMRRMGEGYTIKKMWYGWVVVESHSAQRLIDKKL